MCPLCIGTATLLAAGGTSVSGLTALVVGHRIRNKRGARAERSDYGFSPGVQIEPGAAKRAGEGTDHPSDEAPRG